MKLRRENLTRLAGGEPEYEGGTAPDNQERDAQGDPRDYLAAT